MGKNGTPVPQLLRLAAGVVLLNNLRQTRHRVELGKPFARRAGAHLNRTRRAITRTRKPCNKLLHLLIIVVVKHQSHGLHSTIVTGSWAWGTGSKVRRTVSSFRNLRTRFTRCLTKSMCQKYFFGKDVPNVPHSDGLIPAATFRANFFSHGAVPQSTTLANRHYSPNHNK